MRTAAVAVLCAALISAAFPFAAASPVRAEEAPAQLQLLIDAAEAGGTVILPPGTYQGPAVIDKPLTLAADGEAELVSAADEPAITVTADHVTIAGLRIRTASYGIKLEGADHGEIRDNAIVREPAEGREARRSALRNGIDLYDSHHNRIVGNYVSDMHDAIYVENSNGSVIEQNRVEHSRYGIHLMYTDQTVIRDNVGALNITGAMIMAATNTETARNSFFKQFENVHSQGILLFDAHGSRFYDNYVEGNRVGFYIEHSSDNTFRRNRIEGNFIGVQFIEANGNRFTENVFIGNVTDAEARASADNELSGNFWDSFGGIDPDGDGISDVSNAINPFFQTLAGREPAFQLFFGSPGLMFLEAMLQSGRSEWLTDDAPLMRPPEAAPAAKTGFSGTSRTGTAIPGLILMLVSLTTIYYLGVKRP